MITGVSNNLGLAKATGGGAAPATSSGAGAAGAGSTSSFADSLKKSIDEVSKLQQDASQAVTDLA